MSNVTISKFSDGTNTGYIASQAYFECSTAADAAAKVATSPDSVGFSNTSLINGTTVHVYFSATNIAQSPTLQVGTSTAKPLVRADASSGVYTSVGETVVGSWRAGSIVSLTYHETVDTGGTTIGVWVINDHSEAVGSIVIGSTTLYPQEYNIITQNPTGSVDITSAVNDLIDSKIGDTDLSYLTFSSADSFTLRTLFGSSKSWNGVMEYSTNTTTWATWDGAYTTTLTAGLSSDNKYYLYLRGTGNNVITGNDQNRRFVLTGSNISCIGNIETLLDYQTVQSGNHPSMNNFCYAYLFYGCSNLITAPSLPATTLAEHCYNSMFSNCSSLTVAPELPATTLAYSCYDNMFYRCTSLTTTPELPATVLAKFCYRQMFQGCTSLATLPELSAVTMEDYCYYLMFAGCSKIKVSTTQIGDYQTPYRIPSLGTGVNASYSLTLMFSSTGGTFTSAPSINTTYYTSNTIVYPKVPVPDMPTSPIGSPTIPIYWDGTQFTPTSLNNADTTSY